jgi:hypothetical protein
MFAKFEFVRMPKLLPCLALAGLVFWGCEDDHDEPTVRFVSPAMNATVGPDVFVKLAVTNFKFAGAAAKTSAAAHGIEAAGHIHLYLDTLSERDADAIMQMSKYDTVTLEGIAPGKHYLIAVGADADHDDIESMKDSVAFTVALP